MLKNFSLILSVTAALGLGIVASTDAKGRGGTMEIQTIRGAPIEHRKHKLAKLVRTPHPGIVLNEHYEGDGEIVFAARLQTRLRRHCLETPWLALSLGALGVLGEGQKSQSASRQT